MLQFRLLLLGAALIGGIGMAVYRHYKSREQQQQYSYGDNSPSGSSNHGTRARYRRRVRPQPGEMCSICLTEVFTEGRFLECGHEFHKGCINLWLNSEKKVCPNCRAPVL
ncbi:unnamed protein product [Ceutorhynchus assimilis]|uniref:RING-type domain-containing protein n=1 Tax=Ceutorhynchus assimilis TaxID=467358 RepID=A0A9N9MTD7_9CUCU|nr:unnamed protein product [Ceutorhynchus assimilis]